MSVDAAFFGTLDPQALLFTSAVAEEPLGAATQLFLDNEYGRRDVNKFAALAEAADPVGSLDRATRGQRPDSARAAPPQLADTIRLRSRAGQWLSPHASRLGGGPARQIGIVIEPTPAAHLSSLLLSAYGLTGAQSRVAALVIRGHSTRQIVQELHISASTVQEHLTAAFDKFGVRSRRELVAAMLTGRPG
jgi:DNA-binding CsgD family transcriptional regulator